MNDNLEGNPIRKYGVRAYNEYLVVLIPLGRKC